MRHVRVKRAHNRRVRVEGAKRRQLQIIAAGETITVTEREYQAFRDRFVDLGHVESIDVTPISSGAAVGGGAGVEGATSDTGVNSDADGPDIEQLRREAGELGIKVDSRWREKRLLEEIERATAGGS